MNRLPIQLRRLYLPPDSPSRHPDKAWDALDLIDAHARVRALVLEVSQAAGWSGIAALWQGLQDELGLPAPAIAASGIDGLQVWLSLAEPIPVAQAQDFLEGLRLRYLAEVAQKHVHLWPTAQAGAARHTRIVPALQEATGRWSAFVAPGLANMFADEPWLDVPPGLDAQAHLLSDLQSITPAEFQRAQAQLRPADRPTASEAAPVRVLDGTDPQRFLLSVMNDPATELHLRIEAAKALLPFFEGHRRD